MTPASDPYRTLGLPRGATLDDVKRAYRALAKVNHPDAAGPTALPRWLAIQAAYEQLVHGPLATRARAAPSRPAAADPGRADATRRAYGARPRRTTGAGSGSTAAEPDPAGGPGGARSRAGSSSAAGPRRPSGQSSGPSSDRGPGGDGGRGGRGRNKATLGSTSYDGAGDGPFEPDWGGASWYGTTSGTYWTINPKEYADPRKHGPEYQARARRTAAGRRAASDDEPSPSDGGTPRPSAGGPDPTGEARQDPAGAPEPTHTTSTWWRTTAGPAGAPADAHGGSAASRSRHGPAGRHAGAADAAVGEPPPPPDLAAAATDLGRALTDERTAHGRWRLVQAVVGWLPVARRARVADRELTGCGRFAATCDGGISALTPVLGVAALALLLLVPLLAALAAAGAVALVVAAVPTTLLLSATGGAADLEARNAALGVVLVVAWVVGLAVGIARRLAAWRAPSGRAGPVS